MRSQLGTGAAGEGRRLGLGLDAGGSGTRWVVRDAGGTLARGSGPALSGLVFTNEARERARSAVTTLAEQVRAVAAPASVVAGVTGTDRGGEGAAFLERLLAEAFHLPGGRVLVGNDLHVAYLAAFPDHDGILAYGGTGSAACHVDREGRMLRVGGHGFLLDDGGSGYAVARDALRHVLRLEDEEPGRGWSGPLGRELAAVIGGSEWDQVRSWAYGGSRATIAQAAPAVARAADAGDVAALAILAANGRELGRLVSLLRRRLGPLPATLAGRAATMHPAILRAAEEACGGTIRPEQADAADAAARLAVGLLAEV